VVSVLKEMRAQRVVTFLAAFATWAAERREIHAVALVGSYARDEASETSDVDLIVITDNPAPYLQNSTWSDTFGEVTRLELEEYGKVTSLRVWYSDGLEVEYSFTDLAWIATPIDEGTRVIVANGLRYCSSVSSS
jgi:predicted nucleotidyltransferase